MIISNDSLVKELQEKLKQATDNNNNNNNNNTIAEKNKEIEELKNKLQEEIKAKEALNNEVIITTIQTTQ